MAPGAKHVHRVPNFDLAALLAHPNPSVDLKLESYHAKTSAFLKAVSDYTERATAEISARRAAHAVETKRLSERARAVEAETSECKMVELELLATIEREKEETKQAEALVHSLRRQRASIKDAAGTAEAEIAHYRALVESLRRERAIERAALEAQARDASLELAELEAIWGMSIEGIDSDQLLIRFFNMPQECTLVLDLSERDYKVLTTSPTLLNLPILLDGLNENKDIFAFLKVIRHEFRSIA